MLNDDEHLDPGKRMPEATPKYSPDTIQVISDEEMGQWTLWEVMRHVCRVRHPYFGGDFRQAAMFIEGYACGRNQNGFASYGRDLYPFTAWLMKRWSASLGIHMNSAWWVYVLALSSNDAEAFENLIKLLDEFEAERA